MSRQELLKKFYELDVSIRKKIISELPKNTSNLIMEAAILTYMRKKIRSLKKANDIYAKTASDKNFDSGTRKVDKNMVGDKSLGKKKDAALNIYLKKVDKIFNKSVIDTKKQIKELQKLKKIWEEYSDKGNETQVKRAERALKAYGWTASRTNGHMQQSSKFEKIVRGIMSDRNGYYMFKDKRGAKWGFRRWSQMQTRSLENESMRYGVVETMDELDLDLAYVIPHSDASDSCQKMEGWTISMTGKTKGYPNYNDLRDDPSTHHFKPSCRHLMKPLLNDK